ncbi:MAG: SpoIVB peptidase [Ruminococcaceae bacterium]|nr:SpoIVB peptidase [Oscillospiraceae bacterium]
MRRTMRVLAVMLCAVCTAVFAGIAYVDHVTATAFSVDAGESLRLPLPLAGVSESGAWQTQAHDGGRYSATVSLFGIFPVREVQVTVEERPDVAVCGMPFGIKMFTQGVLVVGISDVDTRQGPKSPARLAGLRVGDSILRINGEEVSSNAQVSAIIEGSKGHPLTLRVRRGQVEFDAALTPLASVKERALKAGMWIRDSAAGIGTLTFYDMASGVFAGLGHPVNDADTGERVPISSGEIVPASVFGVTKGQVGSPGELLGSFQRGSWGVLMTNIDTGLYGVLSEQPDAFATLPIAYKQEAVKGAAQLITTVNGTEPKAYDIEIEAVDYRDGVPTQNMVICVTDEELLAATGGVLCGMSGSPIVQNGKLIGAVTHVFIGDPTRGYAVFAENMLRSAQTLAEPSGNNAA